MRERHPAWQLLDILTRQWWLILAPVLVALVVGTMTSRDVTTRYVGRATVRINPSVVAKPGFPLPDTMIAQINGDPQFRSIAASETGLPAERLGAAGAFTTGTPQDRLNVTFTSEDRDEVQQAAKGLARAVVTRSQQLEGDELERARTAVRLTEDILRKAKAAPVVAYETRSIAEAQFAKSQIVYNYEMAAVNYRGQLDTLLSAYTYDGNSSVSVEPAERTRRDDLVGAAFAGLVVGVALAALREFLMRRPWERGA